MGEEITNGVSDVLKELYGVLELMTWAKKRVNRLIPKILQKCVKEKYNITYYNINTGWGPGNPPGKCVVFCPKN